MTGMKPNLRQTLEIHDNASDPKVKLHAAVIANHCYKFILLDMSTNAGIVSDALKYVAQKTENNTEARRKNRKNRRRINHKVAYSK
jgi:hypothetical protein